MFELQNKTIIARETKFNTQLILYIFELRECELIKRTITDKYTLTNCDKA